MQIAEETKQQFAPDKRTILFELNIDSVSSEKSPWLETSSQEAAKAFSERLKTTGIAAEVEVRILPDSNSGIPKKAVVNLSVANMRVRPGNQAEMASQALLGTPLDVLKQEGGYYIVRTPDHYIAYMDEDGLTLMGKTAFQTWKKAEKIVFTADYGHVYLQVDKSAGRVSDLVLGDVLRKDGEVAGFYQVRFPDGRKGYVKKEEAIPYEQWLAGILPEADRIIKTAKDMMGLPYLWGGTSVKGVDCSGFTKIAYFMNGLIIPRDASQQVREGEPVDIFDSAGKLDTLKAVKNLKPGDLLFFASGQNRPLDAHVTHVALYMGDGEFIHSAGNVRINSFLPNATNYGALKTRTLIAARRYLEVKLTPGIAAVCD